MTYEAYRRDRGASPPLLPVSSYARIVKGVSLLYMLAHVVIRPYTSYTLRLERPFHFAESEEDQTSILDVYLNKIYLGKDARLFLYASYVVLLI